MHLSVKKVGKAKPAPEAGCWAVEAKPETFVMNERLVYTRSDVKALKNAYTRHARKRPPPSRRPAEREEHFKHQKDLKNELDQFVAKVYGEILKDSFSFPVLLRKDRSHDHQIDWRYCLYQGIIYQFDRPGYSDEEMVGQITATIKSP